MTENPDCRCGGRAGPHKIGDEKAYTVIYFE